MGFCPEGVGGGGGGEGGSFCAPMSVVTPLSAALCVPTDWAQAATSSGIKLEITIAMRLRDALTFFIFIPLNEWIRLREV